MNQTLSEMQQRVSTSFNAQGLMATLGAELVKVGEGQVQIALVPRPELSQQHGYIHAGALTSIVDSACGYAALTVAPERFEVLTVEFKINFVRPAVAERFLAVGRVTKAGKTLTVCQGEVVGETSSQRNTIAVMQATIVNVSDRG